MRETPVCTAADAIYKLAAGNLKYLNAENGSGDISRRIRMTNSSPMPAEKMFSGMTRESEQVTMMA